MKKFLKALAIFFATLFSMALGAGIVTLLLPKETPKDSSSGIETPADSSTETPGGDSSEQPGGDSSTETPGGSGNEGGGDSSTETPGGDSSTETPGGNGNEGGGDSSTETPGGDSSTETPGGNGNEGGGDSSTETPGGDGNEGSGDSSTETPGGNGNEGGGDDSTDDPVVEPEISVPAALEKYATILKFTAAEPMTLSIPVASNIEQSDDGAIYIDVNGVLSVTTDDEPLTLTFADAGDYTVTLYNVGAFENRAFYECDELTSVDFGLDFYKIGKESFYKCRALTDVTFVQDCQEKLRFGENAFGYSGIKSIDLPMSCELSSLCFYQCQALEVAIIDSIDITSIPDRAFYPCQKLSSVEFGECPSLTEIAENAFSGCKALKGIAIPSSVVSIGSGAFANSDKLESVYFYNDYDRERDLNLTSIGDGAFSCCLSLTKIYFGRSTEIPVVHLDETTGYKSFNAVPAVGIYFDDINSAELFKEDETWNAAFSKGATYYTQDIKYAHWNRLTAYGYVPESIPVEYEDYELVFEYQVSEKTTYSLPRLELVDAVADSGKYYVYVNGQTSCYAYDEGSVVLDDLTGVNTVKIYGVKNMETSELTSNEWLNSVSFGQGFESIDAGMFANCTRLRKIYFVNPLETVPTLGENAFTNVPEVKVYFISKALYNEMMYDQEFTTAFPNGAVYYVMDSSGSYDKVA